MSPNTQTQRPSDYRKLTEKRIDGEKLYTQIYNELNKQDKLKRTMHSN